MSGLEHLFAQGLMQFANSVFTEMSKPEHVEMFVNDLMGIDRPIDATDCLITACKAYKQGKVSKQFVNSLFQAWLNENQGSQGFESTLKQIHQLLN